jgi:hypothetical protein
MLNLHCRRIRSSCAVLAVPRLHRTHATALVKSVAGAQGHSDPRPLRMTAGRVRNGGAHKVESVTKLPTANTGSVAKILCLHDQDSISMATTRLP